MTTPLIRAGCRIVLAPTLAIAVAVLVKGYASTGDGFAAGVIAALGVLLQYVGLGAKEVERRLPLRFAPVAALLGLALTLAVALGGPLTGRPLLTHAPGADAHVVHLGTLELISAVAFDVGVFLLVFGAVAAVLHYLAATRAEAQP